MATLRFDKVTSLPGSLVADAFYFVENGTFAESYLTDSLGNALSIGNTAMIESVANALITAALDDFNSLEIADDITARDALSLTRNALVLVTDASADATVTAGAALYVYNETADTWTKIAEYESMDVSLVWSNISGRPSSSVSTIDDAVTKRHEHSNKTFLDKIGESGGNMTYDGSAVSASWATTAW